MKYTLSIESLPVKEYLAIKGYMSWREISHQERDEWDRIYGFPNMALIDILMDTSGAHEVYHLFCNSCVHDERFDWVCGDNPACENRNNVTETNDFSIIQLAPSDYLKITYHYGNDIMAEQAMKEADSFFWDEWLKDNSYRSKIAGAYANAPETADITHLDEENRRVTTWHPIERMT